MGFEYQLHVSPPLTDLDAACDAVFKTSQWHRIPTSLSEVSAGIGVGCDEPTSDPSWPQVADLYLESEPLIFVVCHNNNGRLFMNALIRHLAAIGHTIRVDDDI